MNQFARAFSLCSIVGSIVLVMSACGETNTTPPPASPPLTVEKIIYPEGLIQEDSATFERVMRGPIPDSIPRPASAPPRPAVSPFLLKEPVYLDDNKHSN
jgi:hypothetical protein